MVSPYEVSRKAHHRGAWWQPRAMRLEERRSVKRHFAMWREATSELGAKRERVREDGTVEITRLKLDWPDYMKAVRTHKASWMAPGAPLTVRLGVQTFELAA